MPLTGAGTEIKISFDGDAADLIAASNDVIKAINQQKDAVKKAGKEIEAAAKAEAAAVKQAAQSQKQSWTEVRSAYSTVLDVLRAGKAVFDFAKEGAQIEFVKQKFENLSESIGTTSEVLLKDLRAATQGMYSDMELMASATDFVGLGLANTSDEAIRLATVSAGLNMNMNQLVLTLTNMTTMRFDALGVRVDGFKEKVDALKASGMDADAAFKEAFLQQAEAQLELVGNAADTSAGQFMKLEANIANAGNQAKIVAASMFAPLVNKMNEVSEATNKVQTDTEAYNVKMAETGGQLVLTRFQYNASKDKILEYANALDRAAASEAHIARDDTIANLQELKDSAEESAEALKQLSSANAKLITDAISIQEHNDRYKESQQDILNTIAELQAEKDAMNASETEAIADITEKINEQKEKYKEGAEAFGEAQAEKLTMLALEKIAMQDGVAGYSEAEAAKAKLLLDTANIAEESAFRQALAFDQAASAIANGTMAADELNKLLTMMSEHGWSIDVAVNVQKSIDLGSGVGTQTAAQQGAGWQGGFWHGGDVGRGAGIPWLAGGGKSGAAVVGDRKGGGWVEGVSELVFGNFTVVPSAKSKEMLKSGMLGKVPGFAFGGDMGGYTNAPLVKPTYTPTMPRVAPSKSGGGSDPISSAMQFVETQAVDMQASTQNAVVQMAQVTQQMTQSILNSNAQNQVILEDIAAILRHENPRAVGKAVAYEVAKGS